MALCLLGLFLSLVENILFFIIDSDHYFSSLRFSQSLPLGLPLSELLQVAPTLKEES